MDNIRFVELDHKLAAVISDVSRDIFDETDAKPKELKKGYRGVVLWGEDNDLPDQILEKIRKNDVMSPNMGFNIGCGYGAGLRYTMPDDQKIPKEVKAFFQQNNMVNLLLEQQTDLKHFFFAVGLLTLSNDGKKIVRYNHKETLHCRFETCNEKTGKIENVFFANWADNPDDKEIDAIPVLDKDYPLGDLLVRMGREPDPATGKNAKETKDRQFAVVIRIPIPGKKYYSFPYYWSSFYSGWYDIMTMIPEAKRAKMKNGMSIKYQVEINRKFWEDLFADKKIVDEKGRKAEREKVYTEIGTFINGVENQGKVWYSGFWVDANGHEQKDVKINIVDPRKEGGDYIEDSEEASNMICYAQGVHPSLIGATPGKAKGSLSGSDKRELFTMKQALERAPRDLQLQIFEVIRGFNKWSDDLVFDIPDLMLTTLDKGKDAEEVTSKPQKEEE